MDDMDGRKALLKASKIKKGRILDVGMGDCGCMSFFLAKKGFDVIGIDRSPIAIHDSRKCALKDRFKGSFQAKRANAEKMPFSNHEFDAVVAYHALHHVDNVLKVINEMFRVCRKDGHVIISDLHEKGRKSYAHIPDDGKLLNKIEILLSKHTKSIRKIITQNNMMFICRN